MADLFIEKFLPPMTERIAKIKVSIESSTRESIRQSEQKIKDNWISAMVISGVPLCEAINKWEERLPKHQYFPPASEIKAKQ